MGPCNELDRNLQTRRVPAHPLREREGAGCLLEHGFWVRQSNVAISRHRSSLVSLLSSLFSPLSRSPRSQIERTVEIHILTRMNRIKQKKLSVAAPRAAAPSATLVAAELLRRVAPLSARRAPLSATLPALRATLSARRAALSARCATLSVRCASLSACRATLSVRRTALSARR